MSKLFTEIFIASRLGLAPSGGTGNGRRSPAVVIAISGVALAVVVLMISVAVVTGFQNAIRQKVLGFEAPVTISPLGQYYADECAVLTVSPQFKEVLREAASQAGATDATVAPVITQPGVLKAPDSFAGLSFTAYGDGHDQEFEAENLIEGNLPCDANDIVISSLTASKLGLKTGDKVDGCFFIGDALRLRRLKVSGIYSSNFSDYDKLTAYATFPLLSNLRRLDNGQADKAELRDIPLTLIPPVAEHIRAKLSELNAAGQLNEGVYISTVFDTGAIYFNWLGLLDANVVVILVIMSLVSGFTLISCIFILILQRVRMIGLLKSMGSTNGQIRNIFILLGAKVVGLGLIIGNVSGLLLLSLQKWLRVIPLDPESYFLSYVPVEINVSDILLLNAGAVVLSALLMLVPASMIGRISPAKTMHYE